MTSPYSLNTNAYVPGTVEPISQTDPAKYYPDEFEQDMLNTLNMEKAEWDDASVFVTDKESYLMRRVIENARRYTSGIFEKRYDEVTGEKKIWDPMTETAIDNVVKSIDLDTKDVLITPGRPSAVGIVPLVKAMVLNLFKKIDFGQLLNDLTRIMAMDGTVVVKSEIVENVNTGKREIRSRIVDNLNLWLDPSAKSIQDTSVVEKIPVS